MNLLQLRYRRAWITSIWLLVLAIIVASLLPQSALKAIAGIDKVEHFVAYFALTLLSSAVVTDKGLPWVVVRTIALGLAMEVAQALLTDSRIADWVDVLANTGGVLAAWWLVRGRAGWAVAAEAWLGRLWRH
ncbi:MAG: VanZ family protein [Gammaproteobacteria bacterium]|nr:VanZ family protein [Gammaproteobacteria bacterium]